MDTDNLTNSVPNELIMNRIKFLCEVNKKTLRDVYEAINVTHSGFFKMFRTGSLKVSTLVDIANALGVSPEYFFTGKRNVENIAESAMGTTNSETIDCYKKLMASQQKVIELQERLNAIQLPSLNEPNEKYNKKK